MEKMEKITQRITNKINDQLILPMNPKQQNIGNRQKKLSKNQIKD